MDPKLTKSGKPGFSLTARLPHYTRYPVFDNTSRILTTSWIPLHQSWIRCRVRTVFRRRYTFMRRHHLNYATKCRCRSHQKLTRRRAST